MIIKQEHSNVESTGQSEGFHTELHRRRMRCTLVFLLLAGAFAVITVLNINTGSVHLSAGEIAKAIFNKEGSETALNIIWKIRLPRILMAAILGGALSLSGCRPSLRTLLPALMYWGFPPVPRWW